jgi:hypothetical protein
MQHDFHRFGVKMRPRSHGGAAKDRTQAFQLKPGAGLRAPELHCAKHSNVHPKLVLGRFGRG